MAFLITALITFGICVPLGLGVLWLVFWVDDRWGGLG